MRNDQPPWPSLDRAYAAGLRELSKTDRYDSLFDLVRHIVDAAAPELRRAFALKNVKSARGAFLDALIAQARTEAANGTAAERGFYDSELLRAAEWMETLR